MIQELCQKQSTVCVAGEAQDGSVVSYTEADVNRKVEEAKRVLDAEWQRKFDEEGKVVDSMMREKDQKIFEREQMVSELQMRLRLLEERSAETRASGSDLLSLSEQLQNEKATVSRAVAQNRELKEQLLETEDRLLAVTEEKLQSELARQTAEHQVKELKKRLDELTENGQSLTGSTGSATAASTSLEAVMHPSVSLEPSRSSEDWDGSERDHSESTAETSREREHMLETQLEMANQQIEESQKSPRSPVARLLRGGHVDFASHGATQRPCDWVAWRLRDDYRRFDHDEHEYASYRYDFTSISPERKGSRNFFLRF
ncbi:hypothetical protein Y032_0323g2471 [Ancylostoma ceylanicum]|uniref:Golgin subfamily A conserved domain-containing protein n=1 Tax=Ancylostoma ceylanicum TaxID=53326 RepID=A0A016S0B6_9BILA|nr:hypothetical protein Y032_0323g2471 [Ancylostoma ceylanicum]